MSIPMRMATGQLPKVWLLDPSGLPVHMSYADNINNGVTYFMQGRLLIQPGSADKGWCFMKDKCSSEEWAKWEAWSAKADERRGRLEPPPMSERPACIRKAQAAAPEPKKTVYPKGKVKSLGDDVGPTEDEV